MKSVKSHRKPVIKGTAATGSDLKPALHQSEALLNAIIRASPIPMFVIDNHHQVILWNRALENTTGIEARSVLGTSTHWKAFYPAERPCLADLLLDGSPGKISDLYAGKSKKSGILPGAVEATGFFPHLGPGGKWLHFIAAPIFDSGGNLMIGATETLEDITGLVEARQELKESGEPYSALFTNNYSVSLLIDPDTGRITDANEAAVRYYGYPRQRLTAMGIYEINRLPEETVVRNLIRAKNEKEKHFFSTHYRADGEKRNVEIYSGPIRVQGKPLFYSIIHDITDRKKAEQALNESEERYRTLVDQLPDYVIVHRYGILLYVNPAAAARLGYDAKALTGEPMLPFIAPEYHETVREAMTRRMAGRDPPAYEMKIRAKDGSWRAVLVNGAKINFGGEPASLNVLSDITDRKLMEEEVRSLNRVLEQRVKDRTEALSKTNEQLTAEITARAHAEQEIVRSLQEKDLLLREIHHRVKNNLQIIASLLNLQSRTITDPNVLEALKNSQSRIRAMALVHERIYRSHNIAEINLKDYLNYLTRQIFQFYNIQQHQIDITVTTEEILADIDTVTPLGLIINELVSNSLKYAFPEGRTGTISITCTPQGTNTVRIVYHDDGIGMPDGIDWKNSESLGLRLINSLVDQLNGTIESSDGEGTTFIITIQQKREASVT
jgi:PAS domain S-box-containing protein